MGYTLPEILFFKNKKLSHKYIFKIPIIYSPLRLFLIRIKLMWNRFPLILDFYLGTLGSFPAILYTDIEMSIAYITSSGTFPDEIFITKNV